MKVLLVDEEPWVLAAVRAVIRKGGENVTLVAVRVLDCSGHGTSIDLISAIDWVTQHHVGYPVLAVANLSLTTDAVPWSFTAIEDAIYNSIGSGVPLTTNVPGGTANATAARLALNYLGVPYVWGGASPSGFDCSGLASYVYAQVGKSVPHFTGAIWAAFPQVAGGLQPGDLVFFYGLDHMGIYLGGDQFVHAPHTGDVVKVSQLSTYPSYVGAVRP